MRSEKLILSEIKKLTQEYFASKSKTKFVHGQSTIPLSIPTYDWEESYEAIESIMTTWVTMGGKVQKFENEFAKYVKTSYATMVDNGSNANLLVNSILTNPLLENSIKPGDEIITPAVTFATAVYPILNVGAVPVLVDVDLTSLNISLKEIEKAINSKTRAIMPVHLLGNPCEIKGVMELAKKYNLYVIEDACDASGAEVDGQKVGSFGDFGTFSFFFTHIMSTIEGGMVVTNNEEYGQMAKSMRSFGWVRELKEKDKIAANYPEIDPRFLFINPGYNFKVTDIQGAFGIHQLKKLDTFVSIRREAAGYWAENMKQYSDYFWIIEEKPMTKSAWYGYPIIVKPDAPFTKNELKEFLENKGVQTRPILSGNFDEQPVMKLFKYKKVGDLPNSRIIQRHSFWIGNHHGIGKQEKEAVSDYIDEFMSSKLK